MQLSSNNPFAAIPVDKAIEVTVNKDTQTPGGISRFSLKGGAVKCYYITGENRIIFLAQFREVV